MNRKEKNIIEKKRKGNKTKENYINLFMIFSLDWKMKVHPMNVYNTRYLFRYLFRYQKQRTGCKLINLVIVFLTDL